MTRIPVLVLAAWAALSLNPHIPVTHIPIPTIQAPPLQKPVIPNRPVSIPPASHIPLLVPSPTQDAEPFVLIFIDFRDFMCPACLDSLVDISRTIPQHILETRVMGIVQLDGHPVLSPRRIKIAQKKIKGFVHANRILFPVLLDAYSSSQPSCGAKTQIWVLSGASRELVRFELPLSAADIHSLSRIVYTR